MSMIAGHNGADDFYYPGQSGDTAGGDTTPTGGSSSTSLCGDCQGSGLRDEAPCSTCGGTGMTEPDAEAADWVWSTVAPEGWDYQTGGPVGTTN